MSTFVAHRSVLAYNYTTLEAAENDWLKAQEQKEDKWINEQKEKRPDPCVNMSGLKVHVACMCASQKETKKKSLYI